MYHHGYFSSGYPDIFQPRLGYGRAPPTSGKIVVRFLGPQVCKVYNRYRNRTAINPKKKTPH